DNIGGFLSPAAIPDAATRYRAALGEAARYISVYWMGAMVGRFIGSGLLQKIKPSKLLAFAAMMAGLLALLRSSLTDMSRCGRFCLSDCSTPSCSPASSPWESMSWGR